MACEPSLIQPQGWYLGKDDISTRGKWTLGVVDGCETDSDRKVRTVNVSMNN